VQELRLDDAIDLHDRLAAARGGNSEALNALLPVLYAELKRIARAQLAREKPGHTLQPTALVHEAWLRLLSSHSVDFADRAYFLGLAATMMRRILVNHARDKAADKRGGGLARTDLPEHVAAPTPDPDLLALDGALERLAQQDPRKARVVELRYFAGMEFDEIADHLSLSNATVRRDFSLAKLWLAEAMRD